MALALSSPMPAFFRERIDIKGQTITLGVAADLSALPEHVRSRAENLVLLKMNAQSPDMTVSHEWLASRVRALMPALSAWLPAAKGGVLRVNADAARAGRAIAVCGSGVTKGSSTTIFVDAGWFRVERQVVALQDGKVGGRFFARTPDGDIMSVYCEGSD